MIIKLVHHGESEDNLGIVNATEIGDANVSLTTKGAYQAKQAGAIIGPEFISQALIYTSPYIRTRMTTYNLIDGANCVPQHVVPRIYEDPRLREAEFGVNKPKEQIFAEKDIRNKQGYFYYRYQGGESPADVYDRTSMFLDSMMRQAERKRTSRILVVSHGITIRCFAMRFMKLTVEQFNEIENPEHCDIITITTHISSLIKPQFISGKWGIYSLRFRDAINLQPKENSEQRDLTTA